MEGFLDLGLGLGVDMRLGVEFGVKCCGWLCVLDFRDRVRVGFRRIQFGLESLLFEDGCIHVLARGLFVLDRLAGVLESYGFKDLSRGLTVGCVVDIVLLCSSRRGREEESEV